jgi:hypothetical protein
MSTIRLLLALTLLLVPAGCATTGSGATTTSGTTAPDRVSPEAQAAFQQLQSRVVAANQLALDSDDSETLAAAFQTRVGLLQEVGGDVQEVLGHDVAFLSLAALVSLADAYHATAEALQGSPTPTVHADDEEATAAYRVAVDQQVSTFEQEALRVYRQAIDLAGTHSIDDVSAARAREMIDQLTQ